MHPVLLKVYLSSHFVGDEDVNGSQIISSSLYFSRNVVSYLKKPHVSSICLYGSPILFYLNNNDELKSQNHDRLEISFW